MESGIENVKNYAVVVCNEDKVRPVTVRWKCGEKMIHRS